MHNPMSPKMPSTLQLSLYFALIFNYWTGIVSGLQSSPTLHWQKLHHVLLMAGASDSRDSVASSTPTGTATIQLRIGTRPSKLAMIQAQAVADHIQKIRSSSSSSLQSQPVLPVIVPIQASGDIVSSSTTSSSSTPTVVVQDAPLALRNVDFTKALDDALLEGTIDTILQRRFSYAQTEPPATSQDLLSQ